MWRSVKRWLWVAATVAAAIVAICSWRRLARKADFNRSLAVDYLHGATIESAQRAKLARARADIHAAQAATARDDATRKIEFLKLNGARRLAALVERWNGGAK